MKITFEINHGEGEHMEPAEMRTVYLDGKEMFYGQEGICPEDAYFYRDMPDPFDCESLIKKVIEATKNGEEITFEYTEINEDK